MLMSYKVCFVCTGNASRSPFAECVTRKLLADAGMENIEVYSLGTLDWGENPREAAMADVARELGYDLDGTTTAMTRERLLAADVIIYFEPAHRDALTIALDYDRWSRLVAFNRIAFDEGGYVADPHYQSASVYRRVAEHIESGCKRLIEKWREEKREKCGNDEEITKVT